MESMDCQRIVELLPFYLNETLEAAERRDVDEHVAACDRCRGELRETAFAGAVYGQHLPVEVLVDHGFGHSPSGLDEDLVNEHLEACSRCSEELEMVRESRRSGGEDLAEVVAFPRRSTVVAPAWRTAAVAAGIVAVVSLAGWQWSWREAQRSQGPTARLNVFVESVYSQDAVSRSGQTANRLAIPEGADRLVLLLQPTLAASYPSYEVEMRDEAGRRLWAERGLEPQAAGDFTISLEVDALPVSGFTLHVFGRRDDEERQPVATFPVSIAKTPARE